MPPSTFIPICSSLVRSGICLRCCTFSRTRSSLRTFTGLIRKSTGSASYPSRANPACPVTKTIMIVGYSFLYVVQAECRSYHSFQCLKTLNLLHVLSKRQVLLHHHLL